MEKTISNRLRTTFLVHAVISAVLGAAVWLVPGRTLTLLGWVEDMVQLPESNLSIPGGTFVDPVLTRLLGAALLALAFSSFQGWRASRYEEVKLVVQLEALFCGLGILAFAAGLLLWEHDIPIIGWVLLALLVVFAVVWGLELRSEPAGK